VCTFGPKLMSAAAETTLAQVVAGAHEPKSLEWE